mmetsp:Transcript_24312/g.68262  ORF Transcript_24312/g.68262 Transcript_24312/m.68262 type:complete len:623 (+) Transcript_24312:110-1978(+)
MAATASKVVKHRGCAFDPRAADTLLTFTRGHWKLWNKQEASIDVSHNDTSEAYTAACWGPAVSGSAGGQYFALGCASGRVQRWDQRSSEQIGPVAEAFHAVLRGADAAIAALVASQPDRAAVFAGCYATPDILEIGVLDGTTRMSFKASKVDIVQLAASRSGTEWLLSAGTNTALKLWRLPDKGADVVPQAQARLVAPANSPTCIDIWSTGERVLALCADDSMQVDVFSCAEPGGEATPGGKTTAALVLSSHERIRTAHFTPPGPGAAGAASSQLAVVGFGVSLVACWIIGSEHLSASVKTPRAVAPSFIVMAEELGGRILCANTVVLPPVLNVAYGAAAQPAFAEVRPPAAKGDSAIIEPCSAPAALKPSDTKAKTKQEKEAKLKKEAAKTPTVLGPLEAVTSRCRTSRTESATQENIEPLKKRQKVAPGGLSVAPVVRQALRSKDESSVNEALATDDFRVIRATIAELSGPEAFDLLQECTTRLMSQTRRGRSICYWIQQVLVHHCAFIGAQPVLRNALQPLQDAFQARCSSHMALSRLRGRLQMLMNFGTHQAKAKLPGDAAAPVQQTPLLHYVEGDEDVDESSAKDTSSDAGGTDASDEGMGMDSDDDFLSDLEGDTL